MPDSLLLGDCLEVMPTLADKSIDMVLSDLPYGTSKAKWDSVIPLEPLWEQYKRLLKPGGAVVLTAAQPFTSTLVMSNPAWFRYDWAWDKVTPVGFFNANRAPLRVHESILVFCQSQSIYNPQMSWEKPYNTPGKNRGLTACYDSHGQEKRLSINDGRRYPKSLLRFLPDRQGHHPTAKPLALFAYLIKTYTNPGAVVLDNAAGSGTCAVACIETGRQYIAIEQDATYYAIAQQRIAAAREQAQGGPLFAAS